MSTYFSVKLKKKGVSYKDSPYVLSLCTTPARELADEVDLVWDTYDFGGESEDKSDTEYGYYTILTTDKINEIKDYYLRHLNEMQETIDRSIKEIERYREMLPQATNREVFESIEERLNDAENMLKWATEEKESMSYRLYDFRTLESYIEDNEDFELIYSLG